MEKVFILGVNRSGTHLLMSLLSGHPDLCVTGLEDAMLDGLRHNRDAFESALKSRRLIPLYRAIAGNTRYMAFRLMSLNGKARASNARDSLPFGLDFDAWDRRFVDYLQDPDEPQLLKINTVEEVVDAFYLSFAAALGQAERRYVAAKPTHGARQFESVAGPFLEHPLRLVCLVRDPRDVVASMLKLNPKNSIETVCLNWLGHNESMERLARRVPVHEVRYEALCESTEAAMRALCDFLEIGYDAVLLDPQLHDQEFSGNSSFESLQGVSTASIGRWQSTLSQKQVMDIEAYLGPHLAKYGYHPRYPGTAQRVRTLVVAARRRLSMLLQSFRQSRRWTTIAALVLGVLLGLVSGQLLIK